MRFKSLGKMLDIEIKVPATDGEVDEDGKSGEA